MRHTDDLEDGDSVPGRTGVSGTDEARRRLLVPLRLQEAHAPRPRLLTRLDRLAPLTQITAPPGTGRTTLLAEWALHRMERGDLVLWMSARPELDEKQAFAKHLVDAAGALGAGPSGDGPHGDGPEAFARLCADPPAPRVIVVVDDSEHITDPALRRWIGDLCRAAPALHFIGASSEPRAVHPDHQRTGMEMSVLTGRALMLSAQEARASAASWGYELGEERARQLVAATGGWVGLLRTVLDAGPHDGASTPVDAEQAVRRFRSTLPPSAYLDALFAAAGAVATLRHVRVEDLEHLEWTLPDIWARVGAGPVTPVAAALMDAGLLVEDETAEPSAHPPDPAAAPGPLLTVPALLRRALARDFTADHPDQARALHAEAAAHLENAGRPADLIRSARHARRAGDWTRLTRLAARHGWWFGARFGAETIEIFGGLPDQAVLTRPVLAMTRALALALAPATIEPEPRSPMVQRVFARAGASPLEQALASTDPDERAYLATAALNALRQRGESQAALAVSDRLRPALTQRWNEVSALNRAFYYLQVGLAAQDAGDLPRARRRFTRAYEESGGVPSRFVACSAAAHNALILAYTGRHEDAAPWIRRAEEGAAGDPWISRVVQGPRILALVYAALDSSRTEEAARLLRELGPLTGVLEVWPLLLDAHARLALLQGTGVAALDEIEHAASTHLSDKPSGPLATALVTAARSGLLLADGEATRAMRLLDRALVRTTPEAAEAADPDAASGSGPSGAAEAGTAARPPSPTGASPFVAATLAGARARVWWASGRHAQARQAVASAQAQTPARRQAIDLLVLDAASALALGEEADARRDISRVVSMLAGAELATALRALDVPTRWELLDLLEEGPREEGQPEAPPHRDDPLFSRPGLYATGARLIELTEREAAVLRGLAAGHSLADIARADVLSVNTVKKQAVSLYRKLGADTRADAVRIGYAQSLLD